MKVQSLSSGRIRGLVIAATMLLIVGQALAETDRVLDETVKANRAARASQDRIDQLDRQTRSMLERYRDKSWQAQQLTVYADQLDELVAAQEAEKSSIQRQIEEVERIERELLPLMKRMLDGLEEFVSLDLPFLQLERAERLESLGELVADPSASNAEKFARIIEAWSIETEYGRSLGSERRDVDGRAVDVLRIGRTALYYLTADGSEAGIWNPQSGQWQKLPHKHASDIRLGLRMARDTAAPDLLRLPLPAAEGGGS